MATCPSTQLSIVTGQEKLCALNKRRKSPLDDPHCVEFKRGHPAEKHGNPTCKIHSSIELIARFISPLTHNEKGATA